ncbi:unnamed protein product [Acanthoscelides obtectus]|uniref:Uncharacterized protein n=1 Tax=Acanthoscelides obtectus TaxID=200917 RepID=A0A9P0P922_ACAOB|nr:unnamed protein product [Acanthoscelides obtectus]CAK1661661.1 hypothetical protein AOBTE_LOCUS22735 [Acanthoscelides obtectus]
MLSFPLASVAFLFNTALRRLMNITVMNRTTIRTTGMTMPKIIVNNISSGHTYSYNNAVLEIKNCYYRRTVVPWCVSTRWRSASRKWFLSFECRQVGHQGRLREQRRSDVGRIQFASNRRCGKLVDSWCCRLVSPVGRFESRRCPFFLRLLFIKRTRGCGCAHQIEYEPITAFLSISLVYFIFNLDFEDIRPTGY